MLKPSEPLYQLLVARNSSKGRPVSSAGQSVVLITPRSRVRSPYGPSRRGTLAKAMWFSIAQRLSLPGPIVAVNMAAPARKNSAASLLGHYDQTWKMTSWKKHGGNKWTIIGHQRDLSKGKTLVLDRNLPLLTSQNDNFKVTQTCRTSIMPLTTLSYEIMPPNTER